MMNEGGERVMPIARAELEKLIQRDTQPDSHVLSVYLNVDQSRAVNLNRGYRAALKAQLRSIEQQLADEKLRREFADDAQRVVQTVAAYEPRARGLAIFCDTSNSFFWQRELSISIDNDVRWDDRPYVRPLIDALDEYERYAVVLIGREQARLFTVYLGEIEEHRDMFSENKLKHIKSPGNTNARSQANIQRKDEGHAQHHMKAVAEELERFAVRRPFDRLLLAGQHDVTREFQGLLSKHMQSLVVSAVPLAPEAAEHEVLAETQRIEEGVERERESAIVEDLVTRAAKGTQAAMGIGPVLEALHMGRIMRLVYVHGLTTPGGQCAKCESLFTGNAESCAYCGGEARGVPDVISRLVDRVVDSGGAAEDVRGPAAEVLKAAGGVGAFLRF
jgi:peptide subunit release factor 1 (eRF1)